MVMETWTAPDFVEIKMDAEISSYQEDHDPVRDPLFVSAPVRAEAAVEAAE